MISTWILYLQMLTLGVVTPQATFLETETENLVCGDPPILVEVTNITQTTATISWTPVGDETEWDLAVVPAGTLPPITPTDLGITPNPTFNYIGLTPSAAYDVYVRAVCTGTPGAWSSTDVTFITRLDNPSSCQLGLPIPDDDCQHYFIEVSGVGGTALGGDVYLDQVLLTIFHEWADDLDITLISPSGAEVELTSDNGDGETHYGDPNDLTCSMNARFINSLSASGCSALSIDGLAAPFIGDYLPEENLNSFNDGANPNGIWTLEICDDAFDDAGILEYLELVFANTTCGAPADLGLVTSDSTFVVLDWQTASNCATTIIEYGPVGFMPGLDGNPGVGGTVVAVGCPPQTIPNLSPETDYDFYVREMCGVGSYSANACVLSGATLCSPAPATMVEDFNSDTLCNTVCNAPCGLSGIWQNDHAAPLSWIAYSGSTPTQTTGPDDDFPGGGNYVYLEGTGTCLTNNAAILVSNCMEVQAPMGINCHFSFNYYMYGAAIGSLSFEVSTDGGLTWLPLWSEAGNMGQHWLKAYVDLSAYFGQTVQFRFVGTKGLNSRSDIALDNLVFYGPIDQGPAPFTYYQDLDGDTYGNAQVYLESCSPTPPPGYVETPGDCMDNVFEVNPGVPETPCDNFDFNCNGDADEKILPTPVVTHDTICSGEFALAKATPEFGGIIIWYDSLTGGMPIDTGTSFVPMPALQNNTANPVTYTFYAEEVTMDTCVTGVRGAATVVVNPQPVPNIVPGQLEPLCGNEAIDLSTLIIEDLNNTGAAFTFHESLPATVGNQINPPVVSPPNSRYYYVLASSAGGCTEIDSFLIETLPSPEPAITGNIEQCLGEIQTLSATNVGAGQAPFSYQWSNGGTNTSINVSILGPIGAQTTYYLTITDDAGCQGVDSFAITAVTSINSVATSSTAVTDCDGTDGTIVLTPNGGQGPFTYTWSGPVSGSETGVPGGAFTITGLSQGAYTITLTDSSPQGCAFTIPVVIVNGPTAEVSVVNVEDVSCQGFADGCLEIAVVGNNPTIEWSNGVTTAENCNLFPGAYSVTVTDGLCTTVVENLIINQPAALDIELIDLEDAQCFNEASGVVSILAFGGTGPYTYQWNIPGANQPTLSNLPDGSYSVTVTDANGCITSAGPFAIGEPTQLQTALVRTSPSCSGDDDGMLQVIPVGGTPPYSYSWNTGSNLGTIQNLLPGDYTVTVGDVNGCTIVISTDISDPPSLVANVVDLQEASCFGLSDGFIDLDVSGGTGDLTFAWSNGENSEDISNLASGAYQLTVTDIKGCVLVTDSFILEAPELIQFDFSVVTASCTGIPDGGITAQPISGGGPFTYLWSTGEESATITNLEGGSYALTVTDAVGCVSQFEVEVPADQPMSTLINPVSPNCAGGSNGEIFVNMTAGQGPFTYAWNNGATEQDIDGLAAGDYVVTITDDNNCLLITDTITLSDPPQIEIITVGIDSISCFGEMDGNINVAVTGGLPPYEYTWNNDVIEPNLEGVGAGTYILTVEDALNCAVSGPMIVLPQPPLLELSTDFIDLDVNCEGNLIDSVQLMVEGGTAPFSILWSNGDDDAVLSGAPPGDYSVSVTDAFGCFAFLEDVKVPDTMEVMQLNIDPGFFGGLNCDEYGNEGGVRVLITGGFAPYQYNWSNGLNGSTSNQSFEVTGLAEGFYSVTVTDEAGCTQVIQNHFVDPPAPIQANAPGSAIGDVTCKGGSDGSIVLNVTGGFSPYFFVWTDSEGEVVSNDQSPTGLPAGTYDVLVFDANGCNGSFNGASIEEPATAVVVNFQTNGNFCFGDNDGAINLMVSGGSGPYDFLWSTGSENEDLQNLPSGYYDVTVTDKNDCEVEIDSILVTGPTEPISIVSAEIIDVLCFGEETGGVNLVLSGGTMPYSYFWDNTTFNQNLSGVEAGTYSCTILDINSCPFETPEYTISEPPAIVWDEISVTPSTTLEGNGVAEITAVGGTPPLSYSWSTGDNTPRTDSLMGDSTYFLTVTDGNGCMVFNSVFIELDTMGTNGTVNLVNHYDWEVYPNPTNDKVYISWEAPQEVAEQWRILDLYGRTVFELQQPLRFGQILELPLGHLVDGVYWLQVYTSSEQVGTKKIILLH